MSNSFPQTSMLGFAKDYAQLYSAYMESPVEFWYFSFITCFGSIICDSIKFASELSAQTRLYTLILGRSAIDRKSTAISKTVSFFEDIMGFNPCFGVNSAEGLQKVLKTNTKILLCIDEFQSFIGKCSIKSSVLMPCVNTLFENNHYQGETANKSIKIDGKLSFLAACTLETYESVYDKNFINIGFPNRVFIVEGSNSSRIPIPRLIPLEDKTAIMAKVLTAISKLNDKQIEMTSNALRLYTDWYQSMSRSIYSSRLDTYALRLMLISAVVSEKFQIDRDIVQACIDLVEWQLVCRRIYSPLDADNAIATMEQKIRRQLYKHKHLTDSELKRYTNANRTGLWIFNTAIDNMKRDEEITFNNTFGFWKLLHEDNVES